MTAALPARHAAAHSADQEHEGEKVSPDPALLTGEDTVIRNTRRGRLRTTAASLTLEWNGIPIRVWRSGGRT
ncbi:hypothetical protein FHR32_007264 [Streptosporangium album]|uniref:Uncharacterized protein n=1 Tax=Streptosporangium album TaxID=47479 RepID=A0A7W7S2S6_9ACTN|nr:hypothetical protein [Streptosporangium album]MBB4942864.1 hypothetical protein [Streptosporangium album]